MRKGFPLFCTGAAAMCLGFALAQARANSFGAKKGPAPTYRHGEVVVKLKTGKGILSLGQQIHSMMNTLRTKHNVTITPLKMDRTIVTVKADKGVPITRLLADVKSNPQVLRAEPNYIYHALNMDKDPIEGVLPNDPTFGLDWGLLNIGQRDSRGQVGFSGHDIGATKAWALGTGSQEMLVAVIDTGIDYTHDDLKENIFINVKEIPGNGKDDDGNGFIDDVQGWNFDGHNNDPMDDNSHGTHCAGTIGARGMNGIGTAGVNWKVSLLPVKFLSGNGSGSLEGAVESIKYATKMGVKVMSNSWGGGGFSEIMFDAIQEAKEKGILFVAAAGNDSNDNDKRESYPASFPLDNVISVAATDNRDQKASFSNYGRNMVHLAAPGVNIYSTVPMNKGGYATFSGTSMACPHVSGAAALLWSMNQSMTYADIKGRLLSTVDPVPGMRRKVSTGGRLNIYNALTNTIPVRAPEPAPEQWKTVVKQVESPHPYVNSATVRFEVQHPGAKFIRLHFTKISSESGYDTLVVKNASGEVIDELSGEMSDYTTDYTAGDGLTVSFTADGSVDGWGFAIDRYEFID